MGGLDGCVIGRRRVDGTKKVHETKVYEGKDVEMERTREIVRNG